MLTCIVMRTDEVLRLDNISCRKNRLGGSTSGISLSVSAGEYKSVIAGTDIADLLPLILGDLKVVSGSGTMLGYPLQKMSSWRRRQLLHQVGILPRTDAIVPNVTLNEHLALPLRIAGVSFSQISSRIRVILNDMGLLLQMHHPLDALSPSQMRMASLAQVLIKSPRLIIAELRNDQFDNEVTTTILQKQSTHGAAILAITDSRTSPILAEAADFRESEYNVAL